MNNTEVFDPNLNPLLEKCSNDELAPLIGYFKEKISEDLTISNVFKKHQPNHHAYYDLIAKEIRDFGGNSFRNVVRGHGPEYIEIVRDVAKKLKVNFSKTADIETLESRILEKILSDALEKMSESEKKDLLDSLNQKGGMSKGGATSAVILTLFRAGGFASYQLTLVIANMIARQVLGHGLKLGTNVALTRTASILAGPVGMAISAIWLAIDIAGPSYKVTIPSVVHVAMLRQTHNSLVCSKCESMIVDTSVKFCGNCGQAVA